MSLFIGCNYHPHDWNPERWLVDIELMKKARFNTVRLGHLCWDSYESENGVYTFDWFDRIMDLFSQAGIKVLLDVSMHPAPVWVHKLCPGCDIYSKSGNYEASIHRYMEDLSDPAYRFYALRFARVLVNRYKNHPALFAFGLCNEIGSGKPSYSSANLARFKDWLKGKYGTIENLNEAWATRRWCRRLTSFDDVVFPETENFRGSPESLLDMRRFFAEGNSSFIIELKETVEATAPGVPHSSNHYAELAAFGFDYLNNYKKFVDYPGMGFYPGYQITDRYHFMMSIYNQRLAETTKPMWLLEFQSGGEGLHHGPYGAVRMNALLSLINRAQMILGWTWRSMLAGEEQYLSGIIGHDGLPTVNYDEYKEIATDFHELEKYSFPYLPKPDTAVSYSSDNDWVIQYGYKHYRQKYDQCRREVQKVFYSLNRDFNTVNLRNIKKSYKLLILPDYVLMSKEEADSVRAFVESGGSVIMTAYSATVDEHSQVFSCLRPGRLADVFGIRVAGYERTGGEWTDFADDAVVADGPNGKYERLKVEDGKTSFFCDVDYWEQLELNGAKEIATFSSKKWPAVTENTYGKGKAYYIAAEANEVLLSYLVKRLSGTLKLKEGPVVPEGVQARMISDNEFFCVNTTRNAIEVRVPFEKGLCALSKATCNGKVTIPPYNGELIVRQ